MLDFTIQSIAFSRAVSKIMVSVISFSSCGNFVWNSCALLSLSRVVGEDWPL